MKVASTKELVGKVLKELPGITLTASRYYLAERMANNVRAGKSSNLFMGMFVVADVLDGMIMRQFDADTSVRRIADGVVDHLSIARVATETAKKYPEARVYTAILGARAAIVGALNMYHLAETGEVTKGQNHQRLSNISMAAFGLVAEKDIPLATHLMGIATVGINVSASFAHLNEIGETHSEGIRKL